MKPPAVTSETVERIKNSQSKSFRKMNPQIFGPDGIGSATNTANYGGEDDAEHDHIAALNAKPKAKKRIRQSDKPLLNKLEKEFLANLNQGCTNQGMIHSQAIRLRLANGLTYTPDFFVIYKDISPQAYEVKGKFAFEDSIVKLKCAAAAFPNIEFLLVWKDERGLWTEQHVLP